MRGGEAVGKTAPQIQHGGDDVFQVVHSKGLSETVSHKDIQPL